MKFCKFMCCVKDTQGSLSLPDIIPHNSQPRVSLMEELYDLK